jgi:hypothetical protein
MSEGTSGFPGPANAQVSHSYLHDSIAHVYPQWSGFRMEIFGIANVILLRDYEVPVETCLRSNKMWDVWRKFMCCPD